MRPRALAQISRSALLHNVRKLKGLTGRGVSAVVKADGYGHGGALVAKVLEPQVESFVVVSVDEAEELLDAGVGKPVLIMTPLEPQEMTIAVKKGFIPTITCEADLARAEAAALDAGVEASVHIEIDTGMSRTGVEPARFPGLYRRAAGSARVRVDGLYTHLASAADTESVVSSGQLELFRSLLEPLGSDRPNVHVANSAAVVALPQAWYDVVRPGIALYGVAPDGLYADLLPVMRLTSRVAQVRRVETGVGVSYDHTFHTERPTVVATVAFGYADGYHRALSNKGEVLLGGERRRVLGRVCMDYFMVDATEPPAPSQGDEVVLIGEQGEGRITAEEVAEMADTIPYEIFTSLGRRVERRLVD